MDYTLKLRIQSSVFTRIKPLVELPSSSPPQGVFYVWKGLRVASPQKENGFVAIASEIVDRLALTRISGQEMQILWVVLRKTYGWNKKEDAISLGQFSEFTGMKRQHCNRAIKKLVSKKMLGVTKKGYTTSKYMF